MSQEPSSTRRTWTRWLTLMALTGICQGCAFAIVMIPTDAIEYGDQEIIGIAVGLPTDIAVPIVIGASLGPPGALVGALVGLSIAAYDAWVVYQLGML